MKRVIVLSLLVVFAASMASAQARTVVLQQGVAPDAYAGCTTATLWPKAPAQAPPAGGKMLYLRGEHNRLLLKFALPAPLRGKPLARARLWVFLPKASNENRYCEIMCHGMSKPWDAAATWANATGSAKWRQAGGDFDARTAYHNGRPAGAADSVELYAPNHNYWHNLMHWLPVSVPTGGMWVPFNVTALAEKWLANPAANHGVMLMPVRIEDKRMPNPWRIDIPSEKYAADPKRRPKLELELAPPPEAVSVGMTHTLRRINPWSWRYQYRGRYRRQYTVELAGNDYEGFQVVVFPWTADLTDVRFTWADFVDPASGKKLPKQRLAWYCQDMVKMSLSWLVRDKYFGGKRYRVPDPLVPAALSPAAWRDVRRHQAWPFWFTVHAPPGTPPGNYQTTITMTAKGAPRPVKLKLTARVWDYEIPKHWNFAVVGSFGSGAISRFYGADFKPEWLDRWYDFLLDHHVAPVGQYSRALTPPLDRIAHCLGRGMNVIYLHGSFKRNTDLKLIRDRHEKLRAMGCVDKAMIYVEDEGHRHEMRKHLSLNVRKAAPEAMMIVGGAAPNPQGIGYVDVWDPEIDVWPGQKWVDAAGREVNPKTHKGPKRRVDRYTAAEARKIVEACQGRGEKFFWYVAAGPTAPYPNIQLEYPLIAARSYIWMSWKYRATGFEYYCYNLWGNNYRRGARWPEVPWDVRGFKQYNCDGILFYPGPGGVPCSSVRLEAIRDGIEDWESFYILRDYADALAGLAAARPENKSLTAAERKLLAEARKMIDVPDDVVTSVTIWSQDPARMLAARRDLARLIVAIKKIVPAREYRRLRDGRQAAQHKRERDMLKKRSGAVATAPADAAK